MNRAQLRNLGLWEGWGCECTRSLTRQGFRWLLRHWCGLTFSGTRGLQEVPQCLLAPTHFSHLDFWAVLEGLPAPLRRRTYVAAAADHFYQGAVRRFFTRTGSYHNFPFDRRSLSTKGFRKLLHILAEGYSLLLFPQGTRSRDHSLPEFKPLLSLLAAESGVPVVPVAVQGTLEALPPGSFWPRPHTVHVAYGSPLRPVVTGSSALSAARRLNQELMQRIRVLASAPWPTGPVGGNADAGRG